MKDLRRTIATMKLLLILGMVHLFVTLQNCQRFEPEGFFNVNTGSISGVTGNAARAGGEVTDDGGLSVTARGVCWNTSSEPTISNNSTNDGSGMGSFTSSLTGLTPSTTYYVRAYATNSAGTTYGDEENFTTTSSIGNTVTDIDGNEYQTVQIGAQLWMAANMKTTRYADGTAIPHVEGTAEWGGLTADDKAYCWYENSTAHRDTYGGLYTWGAAMNGTAGSNANPSGVQGICPDGWHLPSDAEWKELEMFLGMSQAEANDTGFRGTDEGGKLKETGTANWDSPNAGATNESGFTALPGGYRIDDGSFSGLVDNANFWAATENDGSLAWFRSLDYDYESVYRDYDSKSYGFSVRCVEGDASVDTPSVTTSSIGDITSNAASGGGEVTADGGAQVTARGVCWSTSSNPTILDDTTTNGSGTGTFTSYLTHLSPLTTYYVRAYATNSAGTTYGDERSFSTPTAIGTPVTDIDENEYQTIYVGTQLWMAENLKTTRYADGTEIPPVEGNVEWDALGVDDKAYCWYDTSTTNRDTYGGLYTWATAMNGEASSDANPSGVQGVCPDGWHLPSDADWKQLEIYLGISQVDADKEGSRGIDEGGQLKEAGTAHWNDPNTGATNETGFTALPGGFRTYSGSFSYQGNYASFWTATEGDASLGRGRYLGFDYAQVYRDGYHKNYGFSVRCVKDE